MLMVTPTVYAANPQLSCTPVVKAPPEAQDGSISGAASESFIVEMEGEDCPTPEKYEWEWRVAEQYESTAKRVPESFFDDETSESPTVPMPQWYAANGSEWLRGKSAPGAGEGANYKKAEYEVRCIVTLEGDERESEWVKWNVFVFKESPEVSRPKFNGSPSISTRESTKEEKQRQANRRYIAYVTDRGSMQRIEAKLIENDMQKGNGFYNKIVEVHEGEHLDQWANQAPWKSLFNVDVYYNEFKNLTCFGRDARQAEWNLEDDIDRLIQRKIRADIKSGERTSGDREIAAHTKSNATAPPFLKQHTSHWRASNK